MLRLSQRVRGSISRRHQRSVPRIRFDEDQHELRVDPDLLLLSILIGPQRPHQNTRSLLISVRIAAGNEEGSHRVRPQWERGSELTLLRSNRKRAPVQTECLMHPWRLKRECPLRRTASGLVRGLRRALPHPYSCGMLVKQARVTAIRSRRHRASGVRSAIPLAVDSAEHFVSASWRFREQRLWQVVRCHDTPHVSGTAWSRRRCQPAHPAHRLD